MNLLEIAFAIYFTLNTLIVIALILIYRSMERSLDVLVTCLKHMTIEAHGGKYEHGVQSMAENTKVAE